MIKSQNTLSKIIAGLTLSLACGTVAMAQSSDALLDKLVEKGVLSVKEANQLREETDKDFTKAYSLKSGMPDWVRSLKFNGDLRARWDEISPDNGPGAQHIETRDRFRYRLRFGATATLTDNMEVGLRLGSGETSTTAPGLGGSPFSGNTTLNNDGTRKPIFIDLAYARWTPSDMFEIQAGKMLNMVWTSPMIFSPDYNPEGLQERFTYRFNDKQAFGLTAGQWVIAENASAADTYFFIGQADWTAKWNPKFATKLGAGVYAFADQKKIPQSLEDYIGGFENGTPAVGANSQNFNPVFVRGEATYALESFPLYNGEFPITVAAEYANNPAANGRLANGQHQPYDGLQNEAWNAGITFGSAKEKGNWQISYTYKNIETASLWRGFIDDNFGFNFRGGTDVRGHLIAATYKVFNPMTVGVQYFRTEQINNRPGALNEQDKFLVDVIWSF